jgi:hypothetical protein
MATQSIPHRVGADGDLYRAGRDPRVIEVPSLSFLMIAGSGDPNTSPGYRDAISALYSLSYTIKFALKNAGVDFRVSPLEGLWWADDMTEFSVQHKANWCWTMMIAQPEELTADVFEQARAHVREKKALRVLDRVRLARFAEGQSAQILHVGLYATEGPTIECLHEFIHQRGGSFDGRRQKHHEIYLSDPSRTAPERLRTIVRQPFTVPSVSIAQTPNVATFRVTSSR